MKSKGNTFFSILLACVLFMSFISESAFAASGRNGLDIDGELGEKTAAENTAVPGEYEVTIKVPGTSQNTQYAEMIVMADASDSINDSGNWPHFKNMVNALGKNILSDHTSLKLTLMGFGIGAKHAGTFTTVSELETFMDNATSEDFLQERSATNCEVGFTFVEDYLEKTSGIAQTYVLYLSDAGANMTEKRFDISHWGYTTTNMENLVKAEVKHIVEGGEPLPATKELFPQVCDALIQLRPAYAADARYPSVITALNNAMSSMLNQAEEYGKAVTNAVFDMSKASVSQQYSASQLEKIFQTYFRATVGKNDPLYERFMDHFYVCFLMPMNKSMPDRQLRAAQASLSLQNNNKVLRLYHICYNKSTNNWMNPEYAMSQYNVQYTNKVRYLYGANFGQALIALENEIDTISKTVYKDVTVNDPMSKWVILEPDTIAIYNGNQKIYQYGKGWLTDNPPVVDEDGKPKEPISLTRNANGLYEIVWFIKTGNLLLTDRYSLKYTVKLNEEAEGYVSGTTYPLNDPTTVSYTNEKDERITNEIPVPQGVVYVVDYKYVSDTPGMVLPDSFVPVPVDAKSYSDKTSVNAKMPQTLIFDDSTNNGVWTFQAWDEYTKQIDGDNITFVGKWVFKAKEYVVPATGDNSPIMLWLSLMLASGVGFVLLNNSASKKTHR